MGLKGAIIEIDGKFRALWCVEAPDVWFIDRIRKNIREKDWKSGDYVYTDLKIDPLFIRSCVLGTIEVMSSVTSVPNLIGCRIEGEVVRITTSEKFSGEISIWVCGIRIGTTKNRRFQVFSENVASRNRNFWGNLLTNGKLE
jgi:hypothetical protein